MSKYSKRKGIIISIIISMIICIFLYFFLNIIKKNQKKEDENNFIQKENSVGQIIEPMREEINEATNNVIENQYMNNKWRILISKINLDAPILEGTSKDILRKAVGHFSQTSNWNGNIVLAAHNRGYKYNFFQEIHKLETGDIIEYHINEKIRKYEVFWNGIIKETDLSCLEETEDNQLTLITCVENKPEYRTCVKAKLTSE